jgi:predicted RNA-binding Zn-ribbon protein involved in translation (DUF1610 family)
MKCPTCNKETKMDIQQMCFYKDEDQKVMIIRCENCRK